MTDSTHMKILWKGRLLRRRAYNLALLACPIGLQSFWLDKQILDAVSRPHRPGIAFVLADAVVGKELIFDTNSRAMNFTVNKFQSAGGKNFLMADWFSFPGSWEKIPVELNSTYRCMRELIVAGQDYQQTASYRDASNRLRMSGPHMHNGRYVQRPSDIDDYFETYLRIAAGLKTGGFQKERADAARDPYVGAAIGPLGEVFHFRKGHHRFALARELGITSIPVKVHAVSTTWLAKTLTKELPPHRTVVERLRKHFERASNAG